MIGEIWCTIQLVCTQNHMAMLSENMQMRRVLVLVNKARERPNFTVISDGYYHSATTIQHYQ